MNRRNSLPGELLLFIAALLGACRDCPCPEPNCGPAPMPNLRVEAVCENEVADLSVCIIDAPNHGNCRTEFFALGRCLDKIQGPPVPR